MLGRQVDVVETTRGCTFDCSFCSIIAMRGRQFYTYSLDRVLADIRDARDHGARAIFLIDDNITLNVRRFEALCQAIIGAGLNHMDYIVQAMTSAIANHSETLVPLMRKAGFRYVFLGIENILESDLNFLRAGSKNTQRENGRKSGNATLKAIVALHRNQMYVGGGLIVGNPTDTRGNSPSSMARQSTRSPAPTKPSLRFTRSAKKTSDPARARACASLSIGWQRRCNSAEIMQLSWSRFYAAFLVLGKTLIGIEEWNSHTTSLRI